MSTIHSKKNLLKRTAKLEKELAARGHVLKIESALEKVSIAAMSMRRSKDLSGIGSLIFKELKKLGFTDLRNTEIVINNDAQETITSYYYSDYGVTGVIELDYKSNAIVKEWADQLKKASNAFAEVVIPEKEMKAWRKYREEIGYLPDPKLDKAKTVYYYSYSKGPGALSISSFKPVPKEQIKILKRFRNVFQLSYQRYADITLAAAQTREAEIELALERVRARTMAMQKSDELPETTFLLFQQLKELGETAAQLSIGIIKEEQGIVELSATVHGSPLLQTYPVPASDPYFMQKVIKPWKAKEKFLTVEIRGKELKEYNKWRNSVLKKKIVFPEKQWIINVVFFSKGMISFSSDRHISHETIQLLERFAGVFDQTYTRFLDLQKAEAQTRESQIQLALERVRARSLAMHHTSELQEVVNIVAQQLHNMNIDINGGVFIAINDEVDKDLPLWASGGAADYVQKVTVPFLNSPVFITLRDAIKRKNNFFTEEHSYEEKIGLFEHLFKYPPWNSLSQQRKQELLSREGGYARSVAVSNHTSIAITNHKGKKFSDDDNEILERFGSVFEQSYTRFLDLQKAEVQAREAQVELGLERVRVRAMTMHSSDELNDLVKTLFEELIRLDVKLATCLISTFDISTLDETSWMFHPITREPYVKRIPYNEQPFYHEMLRAWNERNAAWNYCLEGETKVKWHDFLFADTEFALLPQSVRDEMQRPDKVFFTASYYSYGAIQAASLEPFPAQSIDIIQRFSKVFDLSYTRFLDLKKAEAQTKEAQIEAALERVRSRSMAMHNSSELHDVIKVVTEQLSGLGIKFDHANFCKIDAAGNWDLWISTTEQAYPSQVHFPYFDHRVFNQLNDLENTTLDFFTDLYTAEEKNTFFGKFFETTEARNIPEERKQYVLNDKGMARSFFRLKNMWFSMGKYDDRLFTDEENNIFKRFAIVFEQSYIRFLDLQKAEAQARASQIETSLERVRSKTMAMHNSNDVGETVAAMFAEFVYLGIHTNRCGILIFNDQYVAEVWTARSTSGGIAKLIIGKLDLDAHKMLRSLYNAWNAKETFYQYNLLDDDLVQYYTAINNLKFYPTQFDLNALPSKEFHSDFFFADGAVFSFTNEPVIEAHSKIMNRFASVFGQTYRRYLDLQKAEAQAREAKIEAALEKVRSRSLAMHKSQEIQEVINEVFIRLRELEINLDSANILIFENGSKDTVCWTGSTASNSTSSLLRYADIDFLKDMISAKEDQLELFTRQYSREQKNEFFNYVYETTALKETPGDRKQFILEAPCHAVSVAFSKNIAINLNSYSRESFTESENNIVRRFSKVFEQSYTRFLDLQKAEAQAREAQIEVALERVRAKAMAMHDSDDLNETIKVFYQQISLLSLKPRRCGVGLFDNENRMAEVSVMNTTEQGESIDTIGKMELAGHPVLEAIYENWLSQQDYFPILRGNQIKEYYQLLRPHLNYPDYPHDAVQYGYFFYFKEGALYAWTTEELSEEELKIYRRFNSVLSLTYKRYKDLKQAEKNAREAQIEAGLERVRARTMAMFKSDELAETAVVVFKQMKGLGIIPNRLYIVIINDDSGNMEFWITDENGDKIGSRHVVNINKNISLKTMYDGWAGKKKTIIIDQQGNELQDWLSYWKENFGVSFKDDTTIKRRVQTIAYFSRGFIAIASPGDEPRSTINLLGRFAAVFNLTYTRFNDLQIAEAQAMEAQIEAGLERVRARTMAMHNSEDVSAATATMFTELEKLGVENLRCGITIIHKNKTQEVWSVSNIMSDVDGNSVERKNVLAAGMFDMNAHPLWRLLYEKWDNKEDFLQYYLAGKDKEDYFKILNTTKDYLPQAIQQFPDTNFQVYFFGEGAVWSVSLQPHSEEHKQIMKRFTSVFSLTFRRYQDLKKAEAQAREATIEAALEKVRGKAMAMHTSNDLSVTASLVFTELRKFDINPIRCGVGLLNKESQKAQLYSATSSADGDSLSLVGWAILSEHPVLEKIYQSWMDNEEYYPELQGEQMRSYYQLLLKGLPVAVPQVEDDKKQYGTFLPFSVGCLYAWSDVRYNEVEIKILKRFATIIDLTFRRYLELQKSEANAREAVKQAAVDRIRADIASMRTIGDLDRITPLIWNELTILGLPFIRCGVFIMDNSQKLIHTFLSTPDGKAIGAFHLPYDTPGSFADMVIHWENKKTFITHWGEIDMLVMADILVKQGAIATKEQYLRSLPGEGFYLHFLPFLQGMLYVANLEKLNDEQIELIQHVADAFSTAYARYEDFNRLEAAKQQVEKTLTDLKQAQTLLVQSEKMASLGELTAGIAHEIQNPLNFVNNFSEVSNELLEEMKMELEKGNNEDALAIAKDVKQNLEKINHHGKRADSIVKGMLQHSRTSSGQKEMTDINSLADEYLRLAYHGLRAKEKSFNAKFETSFDKNVGEISIIPQDIGRVILNLINNAFYTVSEKKKNPQSALGRGVIYEPTVSICTKSVDGKVLISVKDNGNGIPRNIVDKIFQPFFTTKPTGQGTGLGLSLAYDIIKAHGGDIKVETKEREGTEFIIELPIV